MGDVTETDRRRVYEAYVAAFAETSFAKREELLRASAAEDIDFSNPGVRGVGINNLLAHVSRFQDKFPGAASESIGFANSTISFLGNGHSSPATAPRSSRRTATHS